MNDMQRVIMIVWRKLLGMALRMHPKTMILRLVYALGFFRHGSQAG